MHVRDSRGGYPTVLLHVIYCKTKWHGEKSGLWGCVSQQRHTTVLPLLQFTTKHVMYRKVKVRDWIWGRRVGIVDGGEQGVDNRLSLHLPCPNSVVHHRMHWWNTCWQKETSQKGGSEKKRRSHRMALDLWKNTLPILAIKLKRGQTQTHESDRDRIVEFRTGRTGSGQTTVQSLNQKILSKEYKVAFAFQLV